MAIEQYLVAYRVDSSSVVREGNRPGVNSGGKTNPCADCQLHIARCPWLHEGKPVPGWRAEPTRLILRSFRGKCTVVDTWKILDCPLYVRPDRTNKQDGTDKPYWDNLREF